MAPVVITVLAPTLDKLLKGPCVQSEPSGITWTGPQILGNKKGFDKDISPATISSWIKQTVILCY